MYAQGSHNLIPLNLVLTIVNIFPTNNDSVSCPADLAKNKLILPKKMQKIPPYSPEQKAGQFNTELGRLPLLITFKGNDKIISYTFCRVLIYSSIAIFF